VSRTLFRRDPVIRYPWLTIWCFANKWPAVRGCSFPKQNYTLSKGSNSAMSCAREKTTRLFRDDGLHVW